MYASPEEEALAAQHLDLIEEASPPAWDAKPSAERRRCTICGALDHYPPDSPLLNCCTGCEDFVRLERVW